MVSMEISQTAAVLTKFDSRPWEVSTQDRPMTDAYRDDLAHIHDEGFGGFAQAAAPVLVEALKAGGIDQGLVIDLGCGSGILSRAIYQAGYDVLGVDISAAMIALARQRVPRGEFRVQSLLKSELPPAVAVAAVGEAINYLFDPENTRSSLAKLLERIHRALQPGGVFLFDAAEPGRVPGNGLARTYFEGNDWAVLVSSEEDRRRKFLTRRITSFRQVGELYRRDQEVHCQRLLPRSELAAQLRSIGFRVRVLRGYGRLRFGSGHVGLLARKP
jgi:SAM-dependent methyltransferase